MPWGRGRRCRPWRLPAVVPVHRVAFTCALELDSACFAPYAAPLCYSFSTRNLLPGSILATCMGGRCRAGSAQEDRGWTTCPPGLASGTEAVCEGGCCRVPCVPVLILHQADSVSCASWSASPAGHGNDMLLLKRAGTVCPHGPPITCHQSGPRLPATDLVLNHLPNPPPPAADTPQTLCAPA